MPVEVVKIAQANADALGVTLSMLLGNIVVTGLGCEMLEHGLLSRIMREALDWMRTHGRPDAPALPVLPVLPPMSRAGKSSTKKSSGKRLSRIERH